MKYKINARKIKPEKSPPSRGAWIEITIAQGSH